jgi:hypothetical protein
MKPTFLFSMLFLVTSACSPAVSTRLMPEETPILTPSPTATLAASATVPATITSAPPTFTPLPSMRTFGVWTIVTATPAPKAVCPPQDPSLQIKFPSFDSMTMILENGPKLEGMILEYLNQGGTFQNLAAAYRAGGFILNRYKPLSIDVTNDGIPEIIAINPISDPDKFTPAIYFFGCSQRKYLTTWVDEIPGSNAIIEKLTITDLNSDHIPEIIIQRRFFDFEKIGSVWIYEWNGVSFQSLLSVPYTPSSDLIYRRGSISFLNPAYTDAIRVDGDYKFDLQDMGQNGMKGLTLTWSGVRYEDGPSRNPKITYSWDGRNFSFYRVEYGNPQYRFQAVQDADDAAQFGEYDKAIALYQDVIFNDKLEWYSWKLQRVFSPPWTSLTPIPDNYQDPTEYPRLAAYVYYRLVILHTQLGQMEAAATQYATLQQKFPAGSRGHPYAEMAAGFWETYRTTGKIYDACAAAIAYADAHPEILTPLGSDYHGSQSHIYVPADVCPFR